MNERTMRTLLLGLVLGLFMMAGSAYAQPGHHHRGGHGPKGGLGPLAALDLTDAQKEQIKDLHEQFQQAHADEFEQMKALHEQMREQRKSGDREAAQATREQMKELKESMRDDHEALREQINALLTAEQKAKLEEMHANRGDKCRGKGRKGGDRGGDEAEGGTQAIPPSID